MGLFNKKTDRTEDVSDPAKLLIADHQKVERLFAQLEDEATAAQRRGLVAQLSLELQRHTELEETIVYPFIRAEVPGGPELIDHAEHEHDEAKRLLADLEVADVNGDGFAGRVQALAKVVKAHVKEEEKEVLPALAREVGEERLGYLRGELERAKFAAPTHDLPSDSGPIVPTDTTASTPTRDRAVWVQPHHIDDARWQVRREGATRASRVFDTQAEASDFGRIVAQREKVELIIAGRDGEIRVKDSAGR